MHYWTSSFTSLAGIQYEVSIEDATLTEDKTFRISADGVELRLNRPAHKYDPLRTFGCSISCVAEEDMTGIYTQLWDRRLTISRSDGTIVFYGYVIPAQWRQPVGKPYNTFTIEAQDAIGAMKHTYYHMADSRFRQVLTFSNAIRNICNRYGVGMRVPSTLNYLQISEDAFLPDDYREDRRHADWMSEGDVIEGICLTQGYVAFMNGDTLTIYDPDAVTDYWQTLTEQDLLSDSYEREIIPSVSRIIIHPSLRKALVINDILNRGVFNRPTRELYDDHVILAATLKSHPDIEISNSSRIIKSASFEANSDNIDEDRTTPMLAKGPEYKPISLHCNASPRSSIFVKCRFFMDATGNHIGPADWNLSRNSVARMSPFRIVCESGNTINATLWESNFANNDVGFCDCVYHFSYVEAGRIKLEMYGTNYTYISNIQASYYTTDDVEFQDRTLTISDDFDNDLSVDVPFGYFGGENYLGRYYDSGSDTWNLPDLASRLECQYNTSLVGCHLRVPYTGFRADKLIKFGNKNYISQDVTIDLCNDVVEVFALPHIRLSQFVPPESSGTSAPSPLAPAYTEITKADISNNDKLPLPSVIITPSTKEAP